jgi:chitodextrinase
LTYTFTVTNGDSAACPPELVRYTGGTLQGVASNGVMGTFNAVAAPDEFMLGPGSSATVAVSLTPDALVTAGSYGFQLTPWGGIGSIAANALEALPVNLPNATFTVTSAADTAAPSAPANPAALPLGASTVAVTWSASADNVGVAGYKVLVDNASLYFTASPALTDTNSTPGASHTYAVQAFDRQGNLSPPATVSVTTPSRTDSSPPRAPGNVTGTATDRSLSVTWAPSSDDVGVVGYVVSPFDLWVPQGTTAATISGLPTDTTYVVRVRAVDGSGNSSPDGANGLTIATAQAGGVAPTQPARLYSPRATTTGGIQLAWDPSTSPNGVAGYRVYRNGRLWSQVTANSYTDPMSDLYPFAGYQYHVVAVDGAGNRSPATPIAQTVAPGASTSDSTPPGGSALTSPAAGSTVSGTVTLATAPSDDVRVVSVEFYLDGTYAGQAGNSPYGMGWNTLTSYNGVHALYARAYDAAGNFSTASLISLSVTNVPADPTPPTPPGSVTASVSGGVQVGLVWASSADNIGVTGYSVYRDGAKMATVVGTAWTDLSVVSGSTYGYWVVAYDAAGNASGPSNTATVTITPPGSGGGTAGSITGVVSSKSNGLPLANVKVATTVNGAKKSTTTELSGSYTLADLPAGSYSVTYTGKGSKSKTLMASVAAGHATVVNVTL